MKITRFELNDISKYRGELMGIATILILLCHAPAHIPNMPSVIASLLSKCAYGVDIFLFLSGMGLWYSISKIDYKKDLWQWYKKRYVRILLPCLLVQILFISKPDFIHHILFFVGYSFYTNHDGFWFVDMLLPLYLITPILYKISTYRGGIMTLVILSILSLLICAIPNESSIIENTKQVMTRVPSFMIGFMVAKSIKNGKSINVFVATIVALVIFPLLSFIAKRYVSQDIMVGPFFLPLLILLLCSLLKPILTMGGEIWRFFGQISLESYLMNVSLSFILERYLDGMMPRYAIYHMSVILGVVIAYFICRISKMIIQKVL